MDQPLPLPNGLIDALGDQLDFAAPLTRPLNFLVYENTAWIPTRAQFSEVAADATRRAGLDSLAQLDLRPLVTPVGIGATDNADANFEVQPGALTVATGTDERWTLDLAGQQIAPRPAFGATTGYDITTAGPATLHYQTSTGRAVALIGQLLLWLLLALGISRFDTASVTRWRRRRVRTVPDAPLLSLEAPISAPPIDVPVDAALFASMSDDTFSSDSAAEAETQTEAQPEHEPNPEVDNQSSEQHQAGVE